MNYRWFFICLVFTFLFIGSAISSEINRPPWAEKFFHYVEQEYGADAGKRLRFIQDFILQNQNLPVMEKLSLVNTTMNRLPWIADASHWKSSDYWATPLQTITTFGGDCEDIAIVKWFVLNHLGIPNENLRLAYVKFRTSRGTYGAHMVLLYLENSQLPLDQQDVYVMDNNVQEVKKGSERKDLFAVHLFDKDGNVVLITDNGVDRTVKEVLKEREIRQLSDLKRRIAEDREKYLEISGGKYFMPLSL